jgi:hypothetical protein
MKVEWVEIGGQLCFVTLCTVGASVFDDEGNLLYEHKLPPPDIGGNSSTADRYCRGVCLV